MTLRDLIQAQSGPVRSLLKADGPLADASSGRRQEPHRPTRSQWGTVKLEFRFFPASPLFPGVFTVVDPPLDLERRLNSIRGSMRINSWRIKGKGDAILTMFNLTRFSCQKKYAIL